MDASTITESASARASGRTKGLALSLTLGQTVLYGLYTIIPTFLIPIQVQQLSGGETDVAMLAFAATAGTITAMIGNPFIGLLSDRTRSRYGRRVPWMVVGALVAAVSMVLLANASYIVVLALANAITMLGLNGYQAALTATVPDRVSEDKYNKYSGLMGVGLNLGVLIPSGVFALWPELASPTAYYFLAGLVVVAAIAFALISPDESSLDLATNRFTLRDVLSVIWISPRKAPNFAIVFLARGLLMLGYWIVFTFFYYLLQDYIGLDETTAVGAMGTLYFVNGLAALLGAWLIAAIGSKLNALKPIVVASGVVLAISAVIPLMFASYEGMMAFSVVNGLAFGAYLAVDTTLAVKVLPNPETAGKDLGILNIAMTIPQLLSGMLGAALVTLWGYEGLLWVAAIVAVIGGPLVLLVKNVR